MLSALISDVLASIKATKDGFATLWEILQLALAFPFANTKCERSLSVLKLVTTYLRATMEQERLTNLGVLSIEKAC